MECPRGRSTPKLLFRMFRVLLDRVSGLLCMLSFIVGSITAMHIDPTTSIASRRTVTQDNCWNLSS